jgi:medium-chain acyl-[acyl-carrier-protein] hydrolase
LGRIKNMDIITIPKPNPNAKIQMLCVPFAGGGARAFMNWYKHLPDIELCLVSYPGREHRIKEPPIQDVTVLLDKLTEECQ